MNICFAIVITQNSNSLFCASPFTYLPFDDEYKPADCCQATKKNVYNDIATGQKLDSFCFVQVSDRNYVFGCCFSCSCASKMYMNCASFRKVIVNSRAKQLYMTHAKVKIQTIFFFSYYFSQTSIRLTCDDECEPSKATRSDRGKKQFDGTIKIDYSNNNGFVVTFKS